MKISLDVEFDVELQQVVSVTVNGVSADAPVIEKVKKAPAKKAKADEVSTDGKNIILTGSSLKLNQEVLDLLEIELNKGKKLVLEIVGNKVALLNPSITGSKGGNLVTGAMTLSCKGKQGDALKAIGEEFTFTKHGNGELRLVPVGQNIDIVPIKEQPKVVLPTDLEIKNVVLEGLGQGKKDDFEFDFNF